MRRVLLAASMSSVLLVAGCANPNGGPPASGYSIFYSQADHLKDLVAKGDFDGAAQLYNAQEAYFDQNKTKLAPLLNQASSGFNAGWQPKIDDAVARISAISWPSPRDTWPAIRTTLDAATKIISEYNEFKLTQGERRVDGMGALQQVHSNISQRIQADAANLLKTENLSSGRNFFSDFPVQVSLPDVFIGRLQASFDPQSYDDKILKIARAYSGLVSSDRGVKRELQREVEDMFRYKAKRSSLSEIIAFYKLALGASIAPQSTIPVSVAVYSNAIAAAPFPITIERDVPFDWRNEALDRIKSNSIDADFVVAMGPVRATLNRKVGDYQQVKSQFLAGYRNDPNPAYTTAQLNMQRAQQGMANARSQQIAASNDQICNAYGCQANPWSGLAANLGMIAAQKAYNDAQSNLASTPQTIQTPVYTPYAYETAVITADKGVEYAAYVGRPKTGVSGSYNKSVTSIQNFKLAYKVHEQEQNKGYISSSYSSEASVDAWEKQAVSTSFTALIANSEQKSGNVGWQQVASVFDRGGQAFNTNITQPSRHAQQGGGSGTDKGDKRFASVIVVKTASSLGSGFFVAPDVIVTNAHVVEGQKYVTMQNYEGGSLTGKVEAVDKRRDLALIKTQGNSGPAKLSTKEIVVGSQVEVVGHPQGLQYTLTRGIVSQVRTMPPASGIGGGLVSYVQLDASISPGNSGGPVYQNGEVIGVATWKVTAKNSENLNFAIHRDEVFSFLRENGISP